MDYLRTIVSSNINDRGNFFYIINIYIITSGNDQTISKLGYAIWVKIHRYERLRWVMSNYFRIL